jgi:hypothetical protein
MLDLFFEAAWKVLIAGLVLGAGLPALFAAGVRLTSLGVSETPGPDGTLATHGSRPLPVALGWLCYLIAALAVLLGITVIVAAGLGKEVSFEHVFPTIVPKD